MLFKPNYARARKELLAMMDAPEWDDGSYAPILIRLAWHASATYDRHSRTGGSDGATMRLITEAADPDNAGLEYARAILEPIKARHPGISYADLWILAAYAALEHTGGPVIEFRAGRRDSSDPARCPPNGRLPDPQHGLQPGEDADGRPNGWRDLAAYMRALFDRLGFSEREAVALLCGGHAYGRCHTSRSGFAGAWVEAPTIWSNEYAKDMVGDEWRLVTHADDWLDAIGAAELRPAPGKRQYVNKQPPKQLGAPPPTSRYPVGSYTVVGPKYINLRRDLDVASPVIGRPAEGSSLNLIAIRHAGSAVRGLADCGGWVSILVSAAALPRCVGRVPQRAVRRAARRVAVAAGGGGPRAGAVPMCCVCVCVCVSECVRALCMPLPRTWQGQVQQQGPAAAAMPQGSAPRAP
jgi:hypothetical protein